MGKWAFWGCFLIGKWVSFHINMGVFGVFYYRSGCFGVLIGKWLETYIFHTKITLKPPQKHKKNPQKPQKTPKNTKKTPQNHQKTTIKPLKTPIYP
jgi:hypothetical protein